MSIVVDTNIFVAAIKSRAGASRRVLRLCLMKEVEPLMGAALFAEYESLLSRDALFRDALFRNAPIDARQRDALFQALLSVSRWVNVFFLWRPNLVDESDNHLLELAIAGNASHVVTHNIRDFERSELAFPELKIVSPKDYLKEI